MALNRLHAEFEETLNSPIPDKINPVIASDFGDFEPISDENLFPVFLCPYCYFLKNLTRLFSPNFPLITQVHLISFSFHEIVHWFIPSLRKSIFLYFTFYNKLPGAIIVFMAYKKKLWRTPDENGQFPELTEQQLEKLTQRAFNYCTWSLGQAPKTEHQLRQKMKEKNCPNDIMDATIEKLKNYGFINDKMFAQVFVNSKINSGMGNRRIKQELSRKGISNEMADELLAPETFGEEEVDEREQEYQRAKQVAEKKFRSIPESLDTQKKMRRLVNFIVTRGFPIDMAFDIANNLIKGTMDEE